MTILNSISKMVVTIISKTKIIHRTACMTSMALGYFHPTRISEQNVAMFRSIIKLFILHMRPEISPTANWVLWPSMSVWKIHSLGSVVELNVFCA